MCDRRSLSRAGGALGGLQPSSPELLERISLGGGGKTTSVPVQVTGERREAPVVPSFSLWK